MCIRLPDLTLAECQLHLTLAQSCVLPRHLGSTLRGGIALMLKRSVCFHPEITYCRQCALRQKCVYPAILEPAPPPESKALSTHQDVPQPFVLHLPRHWQRQYEPGDELSFGMTLVGDPLRYLPYVIAAVEHLGRSGLGRDRSRYRLEKVTAQQPSSEEPLPVYEAGLMYNTQPTFSAQVLQEQPGEVDHLTLRFLTPTRLKHNGRYMDRPDFHVVFRALLRRVSSLAYFHCGQRWETDYRGWIEKAKEVRTVAERANWVDWERYSTRQQRSMNLGGVVGEMTYAGELGPFMPLLALGQYVHVGKACAFGNGQYVMVQDHGQGSASAAQDTDHGDLITSQ
ncbi:MAG: CRISPR system precrRNA processing endoribonuclease RAMP protein Cas6 [Anaerolineae bacterium]|nr:CRISPR system precrRNA processing endoribonuclease RAMP protein Cas6 [Anaerolineae bacterium]